MQEVTMKEKMIKGRKIRTNNANTSSIMNLWNDIMPLQLKGDIYAVYYNYESNHTSDYDLLIGSTDAPLDDIVTLKTGKYIQLPVKDNAVESVIKAWQYIWSNPEIEAKRTYQTDFEKYNQDGSIFIYISIA